MAQRLHRETGRSTTPPGTVASTNPHHLRLFDAINDEWMNIQRETAREWKWMRNTVDVTLTPDIGRYQAADFGLTTFGRWREQGRHYAPRCFSPGTTTGPIYLECMDADAFKTLYIDTDVGSSAPVVWAVDTDQALMLAPAPALAYTLRIDFLSAPVELTEDADTPGMPTEFHMLLVWRALISMGTADAAPEVIERAAKQAQALRFQLLNDQGRVVEL